MGGCFSGGQEPAAAKAPAPHNGAKGAEAKSYAVALGSGQSHSRPSVSGASAQVPSNIARLSMSSEKAAGNQEHARHSRANSRTSIASLGDVTLPLDGKGPDVPLTRRSEPGNMKPTAATNTSNAAGVLMDKPSGKGAKGPTVRSGWD